MAAQYDQLGNYLGDWETEEERRKREEELANTAVSTQEIKRYGDGTIERITKEEMPGEFAPAIQPVRVQPVQQTPVAQPVAPVAPDTYGRMIQAESGGRDYDAQGRPLTSPAGAMFKAQVMPATAAQPGYGIQPAQAQTAEEYNRVGAEYNQAMLKQFGGDEVKAAAAYNAGPGRVQQAEAQAAQRGGSWTDYIPKETQNYIQKVFAGAGRAVEGMIPSAQAGTLPQPEAGAGRGTQGIAPIAPGEGVAVATGGGVQGTMTTAQPAAQPTAQTNPFVAIQDDPIQLLSAVKDPNTSAADKKWMSERLRDTYLMDVEQSKAKNQAVNLVQGAAQGDRKAANTIAKELQNQDGSWLKMILLGFISPQLAGEEAVKLGFGNKWVQGQDAEGKTAMIQVNAKGLPLKGYDNSGNEIGTDKLVAFTTGGRKDLDIVGGTYVNDKTGEVGRVVSDKKTGQSYIQTDTGRKPMSGFRPQSSTGTLGDMYARRQQELTQKLSFVGPEKVAGIVAEDEALNGPLPAQLKADILRRATQAAPSMGAVPGAPMGQAQAAGTVAGPVPPTGTAAAGGAETRQLSQTVAPPAPGTQPIQMGGSIADRRAAAKAREATGTEIAKEAGKVVAVSADTQNLLKGIEKATGIIDTGDHNIGSVLSAGVGRGPIAQAIGGQFETKDARNTKTVMDTVQKLATEGLKALGSNPSTADLEFWTRFKPDASSDPEFVKEWINSRADDLKRRLGYAEKQVEAGGKAGVAPEVRPEAPMSPADKARAELERRRKEKK